MADGNNGNRKKKKYETITLFIEIIMIVASVLRIFTTAI
ncbi:DUF4044 domain-containing protein, partial [Streptococcus pneumoniae]